MKKHIKSIVTLTLICAITSILLAFTNSLTAPVIEEAEKAVADGADYVAVSPVFSTASKSDAGDGHGLEIAQAICEAVSVPVVGIGGLNKENIAEVIKAGIDGIAVISAVVSQEDISASAAELSAIIAEAKRSV